MTFIKTPFSYSKGIKKNISGEITKWKISTITTVPSLISRREKKSMKLILAT